MRAALTQTTTKEEGTEQASRTEEEREKRLNGDGAGWRFRKGKEKEASEARRPAASDMGTKAIQRRTWVYSHQSGQHRELLGQQTTTRRTTLQTVRFRNIFW